MFYVFAVPSENSSTSAESNGEVSAKNECRCQAANCRKIMFSLPENQVIAPFLKTSQEDWEIYNKCRQSRKLFSP